MNDVHMGEIHLLMGIYAYILYIYHIKDKHTIYNWLKRNVAWVFD